MRKRIVLLLSLPAAMYLHAQDVSEIRNAASVYGNNMSIGSAKYMGMAGSMGAIGGDVSSINNNPAGVGVYITGDFQGTLGINSYKNTSTLGSNSISAKSNNTDLSQIGGVMSFPVNNSRWQYVNIGVNYINQNLDSYILSPANNNISENITYTNSNGQTVNDVAMYDGHGYNRTGHLGKMSIAVGGNYDNKIYVGAGLNFHSANFDQADSYAIRYQSNNGVDYYDKQYSPYSENSTGFSASVGIIGKVTNEFRLGASIETPTWWNTDRAFTVYSTNDANDFVNANTGSESRNFRSSAKATLSAAFIPAKNFALNVDYTIGIAKPKFTTYSDANNQLNDYFDQFSKSQSEVKVGAEYRIQGFRLRAGYAYASNPFDNETLAILNNDGTKGSASFNNMYIGKRNTVGAGIGYDFKSFYIDAAYQNVSYTFSNPFFGGDYATYSNNWGEGVNNANSIVSNVKNKQNNIFITLGYKF